MRRFLRGFFLILGIAIVSPGEMLSQTVWVDGTGDWFVPANWSAGVPTAATDATITNAGTAQIAAAGAVSNALTLGLNIVQSGNVSISGAGNLTTSGGLTVGESGSGSVSISAGGDLTTPVATVGRNAGSSGTVTVTGAGSTWTNNNFLFLGFDGDGTLNILAGGSVLTSGNGMSVGLNATSTSSLTVDGMGSLLNVSGLGGNLDIGSQGAHGTMMVTAGGKVMSQNGSIGRVSGGVGTATVDGTGSSWSMNQLSVGGNGTGTTGTLNVTNGGSVTSAFSNIGSGSGAVGTATITGTGSSWFSGQLTVGNGGTGTLNIQSAGLVTSTSGTIGDDAATMTDPAGAGTVNVAGMGSMWTNSGNLKIGNGGVGSLHITSGGAVSNVDADLGISAGSSGTATVDGAGSTWTITGFFDIGVDGTGTFSVTNGGVVTTTKEAAIGEFAGTGMATVDGTGSKWTITDILDVGENGTATLMVSGGGAVSNTSGFVGSSGTGNATVTGAGSSWTNSSNLVIGEFGNGTLHILNGGTVIVNGSFARIAQQDTSTSSVTVDGAGSTWTLAHELDVARGGTGSLLIQNGGTVNMTGADRASIGVSAGSNGMVTVDGAGSTWTDGGGLFVGDGGNGTLHVLNGATVSNTFAQLGSQSGASGTANIDGAGSVWDNNGTFLVGASGTGMMTITNGGRVASNNSQIGSAAGGVGTVIVDGTNSKWGTSSLFIGGDPAGPKGTGLLRLLNGAEVSSGNMTVWNTGTVELGASFLLSAPVHFDGGTLRTIANTTVPNNIDLLAGGMRVESGPFTSTFSGLLSGPGGLFKFDSGAIILTNTNTYTGFTNVNEGSLIIDGSVVSEMNVDALLGGTGLIAANINNGGVVSPGELGSSTGTLTSTGAYFQSTTGILRIEIGGLGMNEHDLLLINGNTASLDGTLQILRANNFIPHNGDSFTILLATGAVNGEFANVTSNFQGVLQPEVVYNPTFVDVVFVLGSFVISDDLTPNQLAVAHQLNKVGNDPLAGELIDFIGNVPLVELPRDYDLIAPEELASLYEISFSHNIVQNMNLQHRMDDIRAGSTGFCGTAWQPREVGKDFSGGKGGEMEPTGKVVQPASDPHWGVFAAGSGEFINVDGDFNAHGYDITTGSFIAGADYRIGTHFAIGVDGGYAGSNAALVDNGEVEVDGGRIGAYATLFGFNFWGSNIHIDGAVGGGWNTYDTHRTGLQDLPVQGSTEGSEFDAMIAYGGDWHFGCLLVGTWSTIQYINVDIDGFTETGSLAPLHIEGQDEDSFIGTTGVRFAYDWRCGNMIIRPEVRAAWMHESNDRSYPIDAHFASGAGDTFTVHGPKIGRDAALIDAGVAVLWSSRISSYVYYDGVLGRNNYTNNSVSGGLKVSF